MKIDEKKLTSAIRFATGSLGVWTHELEENILSELIKISDRKIYKCTDCQTNNFLKDNGKIKVGYCFNCEHPIWNEGDFENCEGCEREFNVETMRMDDEDGNWWCRHCLIDESKPKN